MAKVVAKFERVSFKEFRNTCVSKANGLYGYDKYLKLVYDKIKLPVRSTSRSSGYDFFYPGTEPLFISKGKRVLIPTGIKCKFLEDDYDLIILPRSSMGRKGLRLLNTMAVIDNDYWLADNEGHIMIMLTCDNNEGITINPGDRFAQGIIREYFLAEGDNEVKKHDRVGGIGSTGE